MWIDCAVQFTLDWITLFFPLALSLSLLLRFLFFLARSIVYFCIKYVTKDETAWYSYLHLTANIPIQTAFSSSRRRLAHIGLLSEKTCISIRTWGEQKGVFVRLDFLLCRHSSEQPPLFSCKAHIFQVDPDTRKSWIPLSNGASRFFNGLLIDQQSDFVHRSRHCANLSRFSEERLPNLIGRRVESIDQHHCHFSHELHENLSKILPMGRFTRQQCLRFGLCQRSRSHTRKWRRGTTNVRDDLFSLWKNLSK